MREPRPMATEPTVAGVLTRPSACSVGEMLARLQVVFQSHNLTIFARIDHSDRAKDGSLTMQEAHVLIYGNPQSGTPLMVASPLLALDLPLRVLVWQGADGRVWVSSTSASYLQARYSIPRALVGNIAGSDTLIERTLQS